MPSRANVQASLIATRSRLRAGLRQVYGRPACAWRLAVWTAETVLVCALALLGRGADSLPQIVLLDARPSYASLNAEGFVRRGEPRIYLLTTTAPFAVARRASRPCGDVQALRKIASVVIHEEWHVRHPGDEAGAYTAQLGALVALGAGPGNSLWMEVWRARQAALRSTRAPIAAIGDR